MLLEFNLVNKELIKSMELVITILLSLPAIAEQVCLLGFIEFPFVYGIPICTIHKILPEALIHNSAEVAYLHLESRLADSKVLAYRTQKGSTDILIREQYHKSHTGMLVLCAHAALNDDLKVVIRANIFAFIFILSLALLVVSTPFPVIMQLGIIAYFIVAPIATYFRFRKTLIAVWPE